ncbi:MAG: histidine phosphatase family protein [Synergistota bacterium]|nr:histidine phosphatase family protein [Synergistota bacterium]
MRLFLVRHGLTDWNTANRFQGKKDIPLNSEGLRQAGLAAGALENAGLDAVWSSPLSRAFETASAIGSACGVDVQTHAGLAEIDHGDWEGLKAPDVEARWPGMLNAWRSEPGKVTMPGGESLTDVLGRALGAVSDISAACGRSTVAVVTHDAVLKVLLCNWLGMDISGGFWRFQLANASISIFELDKKGARTPLIGDACHLGDPFERPEQKGL